MASHPVPAAPTVLELQLLCPGCGERLPVGDGRPPQACGRCGRGVRHRAGVWDLLAMTPAVQREYRRQMQEAGFPGTIAAYQVVELPALGADDTEARLLRALALPAQNVQDDLTWHNYLGVREAVVRPGTTLLELGCRSPSYFLRDAARAGVCCVGVDLYFHTDGTSDGGYLKILGDMCHLPLATESVDTVLVSSALHHAPDLEHAVREVHRVLRPGGRFVVLSEPPVSLLRRWRLLRARPGDKARFTCPQYLWALRRAGFDHTAVQFPPYVQGRFARPGRAWRRRMGAWLALCWRLPGGQAFIRRVALWPGLWFAELPLVAVTVK